MGVKLEREKIELNQLLTYIHPLSSTLTPFFLFAPLQLSSQNKITVQKKIGVGGYLPPCLPSYFYDCGDGN
jgi:hypothetical protein